MEQINIDSKTFNEYGISILTGEADAISMRMLCELDVAMTKTYLEYTGFQFIYKAEDKTSGEVVYLAEPLEHLNKSNHNDRTRYSCFLTHEVMEDLLIMRLMKENEMVVEILPVERDGFHVGSKFLLAGGRDELREYLKDKFDNNPSGASFYKIGRSYWIYQAQPRVGFSNVHAFTGTHQ